MFQSAPPTEVRGDLIPVAACLLARKVSIRSPHRSEGRFTHIRHNELVTIVSIRSPHRSEGRLILEFNVSSEVASFNPLPPPK